MFPIVQTWSIPVAPEMQVECLAGFKISWSFYLSWSLIPWFLQTNLL